MYKTNNKKAFTIIELIVVIVVLGILVLIGLPKLLGYVEKAQLARIQHDVKIMESMMEDELVRNLNVNYDEFKNNNKQLEVLILANRLFEKEGHAKNIQYPDFNGNLLAKVDSNTKMATNQEILSVVTKLGIGGSVSEDPQQENEISFKYKVIPDKYKVKAGSRLKGTFYTNESGKVYYEHDKPLTRSKDFQKIACEAALPDYTFEYLTGTIVKYHGNAQHLIIPPAFEVDGRCWPVLIIGKGAFMQGGFREVVIPEGVIIIEEDAFKDNELEKIIIPGSVSHIGDNAFADNHISSSGGGGSGSGGSGGSGSGGSGGSGGSSAIIKNEPANVIIGGGAFSSNGPSGTETIVPQFKPRTDKDMEIVFDKTKGEIVEYHGKDIVVVIPPTIIVDGVEYPVKSIGKGSYQGKGLITVILPEGLERIEDYAFSGNQLIGIRIPLSVNHIGNYAFAFNELEKVGNIPGPKTKATITTILMKEKEQFNKLNKYGDILEGGQKVDTMIEPDDLVNLRLLDHIFVTSHGNVIIDVEEILESNNIIFAGLGIEAFDGDTQTSTYASPSSVVTWDKDLSNKLMSIKAKNGSYTFYATFYNDKDEAMIPIGYQTNLYFYDTKGIHTIDVIVPKDATKIKFTGSGSIYEISVAENSNLPLPVENVTSTVTNNSITLNWQQNEPDYDKSAVYKDDKFIGYSNNKSYKQENLYSDTEHSYKIIAINKSGNASEKWITHTSRTNRPEVLFTGLGPQAFDGNTQTSTYASPSSVVTWDKDLSNKLLSIRARNGSYTFYATFYNDKDEVVAPIGYQTNLYFYDTKGIHTIDVIVPKDATKIKFTGSGSIYEISVAYNLKLPLPVTNVTSISTANSVSLNWQQNEADYQRSAIYRNGTFLAYANGHAYVSTGLITNTEYNYEIIAISKSGNASSSRISHKERTK